MAPSPLAGLRGALASLDTPLLLFATLRVLTRFAVWLTGAGRRTPRFVQRAAVAAHFAALAAAGVALFAALFVDEGKFQDDFERCGPSVLKRQTGLVGSALLFLYASSSSFFVVCASVLGLRLLAAGDTAAAFIAANVALVDDSRDLDSMFATVGMGVMYSYVVQIAQARWKECGVRDAALLAAVAWVAAAMHAFSAIRRAWRVLRA